MVQIRIARATGLLVVATLGGLAGCGENSAQQVDGNTDLKVLLLAASLALLVLTGILAQVSNWSRRRRFRQEQRRRRRENPR